MLTLTCSKTQLTWLGLVALAAAGDGPLLLPCSGLGDGLLQQTGGELLSEP